eukprot:TRINITY_DN10578_c0_g1_i1.p1 TRINITY_DN10578_c0_g1~~TRINITY_DN10578_c0_g1_i1.p1  ORF type:complete len:406 (+),score=84.01 TRINITY_DN10578_c0_g1_i1:29-1219(+)
MASYVSPLNTLGTPGGATGPTFSPHSMSASSSMASMAFSPSAASTASAGDMSDGESDPLKGYHAALDAIQSVDEAVKTVAAKPLDAAALLKLEGVQRVAQMHVLPIYDELLRELRINSDIKRVHGGSANDDSLLDIKLGEPVPAYFANVKNESIYRRKVLSVLGLRNLIPKGTAIFGHMQGTLFSGEEGRYGHAEGLRLMRKLTGNTVDLDDVVLRCDDGMMKMINSANQKGGLPTYGSAVEFSASQQARNIATDAARLILNNFNQQLGLDENQQKQRNVYLPEHYAIPMAHSNSDRAKCPLWHVCPCLLLCPHLPHAGVRCSREDFCCTQPAGCSGIMSHAHRTPPHHSIRMPGRTHFTRMHRTSVTSSGRCCWRRGMPSKRTALWRHACAGKSW